MFMARPLNVLSTITKPIVWLLSKSTDIAVRLLGGDPDLQREQVTGDELRDMVAIHETFPPEQRQIIDGAFEIAERTLDEVMVPRNDVVVIDADATCAEALALLVETGHSRAPVAEKRNLDRPVGMVGATKSPRTWRRAGDLGDVGTSPRSPTLHGSSPPCVSSRPDAPRWPWSSTNTVARSASSPSKISSRTRR
jgi:Mg2+/Co2+ transporter CorB